MTEDASVTSNLKEQFLKESAERLRDLERGLLNIEQGQEVMDQVRLIFRGFHGLKGIAGYVKTREIIDLSNAGESLLMQVRDEGVPFKPEWVDLLLECHDELKRLVECFRSGTSPSDGWREKLERINGVVRENAGREASAEAEGEEAKLFKETADPQISGLEVYFRKWKPGLPDKRLIAAVKRKLALFSSSANKVGRADLARIATEHLNRLEQRKDVEWTRQQIQEFTEVGAELRSHVEAEKMGKLAQLRTPTLEPVRVPQPDEASRVLEIKADYVEMLEALVSDFTIYSAGISRNLKKMRPLVKPRALLWLDGMESDLKKFARALTLSCRRLHLVSLVPLFQRFPRLIRDLAKRGGKKVRLEVAGAETEMEKHQVEKLAEPMTHLIRNAVDHGLEPPEQRAAAGKDEQGVLQIRASLSKQTVTLEISDDGRGIDFDKIRARAVELGVYTQEQADSLPEEELMNLVFLTGLSTRSVADTISGRGVGMDIVREAVAELGGTVEVDSSVGKGTVFRLRIPLELG